MWPFKEKIKAEPIKIDDAGDKYMVLEMGQSLAHELWYCQKINCNDLFNNLKKPRRVYAEEYDTPEEAMAACDEKIKNKEFIQ